MNGSTFNPGSSGAGTHVITYSYTDGNGCSNDDQISITVFAQPNVSINSPFSTVCEEENAFSLSGTPSGGSFSGSGVTGSTFTPVNAGVGTHIVTYSYTDSNGCSSSDETTIVVDDCVGIEEMLLSDLVLYPNPNNGIFRLSKNLIGASLKVYSMDGKVVYSNDVLENDFIIELQQVQTGVYNVEVEYESVRKNIRLIIQN